MTIIVLNGSPKGDVSVTMQYIYYLRKKYPQHDFSILNIAQKLHKLEQNQEAFQEVLDQVAAADGVIWAFPLYFCLVHGNYKRFIELIYERRVEHVFNGKYVMVFSTSIHFYDHTAQNYMHAVCDDLLMKYAGGYSASMYDLKNEHEQQRFLTFVDSFFDTVENKRATFRHYPPVCRDGTVYVPGDLDGPVDSGNKKVCIVADSVDTESNLGKMINRCSQLFNSDVDLVELDKVDIKGGCTGCIQCGYDNTCFWEGRDEYIEMFKNRIMSADILIFAGEIKDRYLSARWKTFWDRSFFNTHQPSLRGKQIAFLVSGPLSQNDNLQTILTALVELMEANLVEMVSDEAFTLDGLDCRLTRLAEKLVACADNDYFQPQTYLSVGGVKIFRDVVWGQIRFPFRSDYLYYKEHGFFDFPQKNYMSRLQNGFMLLLCKIPAIRKTIYKYNLKKGMIESLQKVVEKA